MFTRVPSTDLSSIGLSIRKMKKYGIYGAEKELILVNNSSIFQKRKVFKIRNKQYENI